MKVFEFRNGTLHLTNKNRLEKAKTAGIVKQCQWLNVTVSNGGIFRGGHNEEGRLEPVDPFRSGGNGCSMNLEESINNVTIDFLTRNPMSIEDFPKALFAWRKAHGLTQKQLAEKIGATQGEIHKWEAGRSFPWMSLEKLNKIGINFNITFTSSAL